MSIEEGFKAVHSALFGAEPGKVQPCGTCSKCKKPLIVSAVDGNAQGCHRFKFEQVNKNVGCGILNGLWAKLEWEADLCNQCLLNLSDWLLGPNWRHWECIHCRDESCGGLMKRIEEGEYRCEKCGNKISGWLGCLERDCEVCKEMLANE